MTSWSDVQSHMRAKYRLIHDEPHAIGLMWSYEDGRTQKIVVRQVLSDDRQMVEFKSPFARQGEGDPTHHPTGEQPTAFRRRRLVRGRLHRRSQCAARRDAPGHFEFLVDRIAAAADHLERQHIDSDTF